MYFMRTNNPLSLLKDPGFKRVWAVGLLANTMRWLEMLAIGIFVYDIEAAKKYKETLKKNK